MAAGFQPSAHLRHPGFESQHANGPGTRLEFRTIRLCNQAPAGCNAIKYRAFRQPDQWRAEWVKALGKSIL